MNTTMQIEKKKLSDTRFMSGCEILIRTLLDENVGTVFGYPGGVLLGIYDELYKTPRLQHILVRHEQGATHAADGYARVTGKPGVVIVTSGPGATNTITGITTAYMDSVPLVVFTGQVTSGMIGKDAFQEADIIGISRPVTKHSYLVKDVNQLQNIIKEAFHIATTGRPGPVLVDLPVDVMRDQAVYRADQNIEIQGYKPVYDGHSSQIDKAIELINSAERPVIYAGGGVNIGDASELLKTLARKTNIPVTTTLLGLGVFPENDNLSLGMVGMHGTWYANMALTECDLLIAIGARFDDRVTGNLKKFSLKSKKIHIDIDPSNIAKVVKVDVPIVGHVKNILPHLIDKVSEMEHNNWLHTIDEWKRTNPLSYNKSSSGISPQFVIEQIAEATAHEAIVVTDVGQNQMWAAQYYGYRKPRSLLSSGGLGTMGYGLPAAMGASLGSPERTIVCITGDGGFQMNSQELATAVHYKLPLKIVLLNNGFLGMVRQWQDLFYDKRYSHTHIDPGNPDFIKLAESYGAAAIRITSQSNIQSAIAESMNITDRPVIMEFIIAKEENVFPMVPAGKALSDMIINNGEET